MPQISQDGESDPPEERPLALCHPLPSEDFGLGPTRRGARPEARGDVRGSQPVEEEPLWVHADLYLSFGCLQPEQPQPRPSPLEFRNLRVERFGV